MTETPAQRATEHLPIRDSEWHANVRRDDDAWRVVDFAAYCLQPGDEVEVVDGRVMAVTKPVLNFWVTVYCLQITTNLRVQELALEWSLSGLTTGVPAGLVIDVAGPSIADIIKLTSVPEVDWRESRRTPVERFDLAEHLSHNWLDQAEADRKFDSWMGRG